MIIGDDGGGGGGVDRDGDDRVIAAAFSQLLDRYATDFSKYCPT